MGQYDLDSSRLAIQFENWFTYEVSWALTHTRVIKAESEDDAIRFCRQMGWSGLEAIMDLRGSDWSFPYQNGKPVQRRVDVSAMKATRIRYG